MSSPPAFELQPLGIARDGHDAWCRILKRGEVVVEMTDGAQLEAQIPVEGGDVLFVTYASPFDEGLHVMYIDAQGRLCDEARIGFIDPSGVGLLADVRKVDERHIDFDFYGSWRVEVDAHGRLPGPRPASGVHRPWRRWLTRHHLHFRSSSAR